MLKKYPMLSSLLASFLLVAYVFLVSMLLNNGDLLFGKTPTVVTGLAILLLLVFSVLICGLLLLGGPIYLYFEKKKKEAFRILLSNVIFLAVFILIILSLQILFKFYF